MKKIEELEIKHATVVLDVNNKAISNGNVDEKLDQNKKIELNTEKWIEKEKILMGFENDCNRFLVIHKTFDLDDVLCDKCKFKSHSQGLLEIHKQTKHKSNETFEDIKN